jgi:Transposase domain (DUF772)
MIRMLIVGYCCGIRSERRLTKEVELHLAYRWFCRLDLEDEIPHHSTFSANRLGRFRESDVLRHVFERVVWAAPACSKPTPAAITGKQASRLGLSAKHFSVRSIMVFVAPGIQLASTRARPRT